MRRFAPFAAILAALTPAMAQAAEVPCLTPAEFTAVSTYALPSIVTGATQRCTTSLTANAWLPKYGAQLAARYVRGQDANWPAAKAVFIKLSAANGEAGELVKSLPDPSLRQMLDGLIAGMVAQQLPLERCGAVDSLLRLLSPLPAQNTAEIIGVGSGLMARSGRAKLGMFSLCPA